jgi:hypothetical protein
MAIKSPPSLQAFLAKAPFPMAKPDLVELASEQGVPPDTRAMLDQLPDTTYMTPVDVSLAVADVEASPQEQQRRARQTQPRKPKQAAQPQMQESPKAKAQTAATRLTSRVTDVAKTQLESRKGQATEQLTKAAQSMRQSGQQLRTEGNTQLADVTDVVVSGIEKTNDYLRTRDIDTMVREAETTIRKQRTLVIGAAFAAAFLLTRSAKTGLAGGGQGEDQATAKKQNER